MPHLPPSAPAARKTAVALILFSALHTATVRSQSNEVILQYFNTDWKEIEYRMPEIAEAGYTSLWLPPPFKGASGTFSVGFDTFDRFDLGDRDQMGTVPTKYGTRQDLLDLVEIAHRFGLRVYFDNVMAHTGGPLDAVGPSTLFPSTPGFVPEDFHLVRRSDGGWRKATDDLNYQDEWQVLNRNPFAWDIAQESPNTSFNPSGSTEGQDFPKWAGVRHPGQTHLYLDDDLQVATNGLGLPVRTFADKEPFDDVGYGGANAGAGNGRFDWDDTDGDGQHDAGETSEPFADTGIDPSNPARRNTTWGFGDGIYNMGDPVSEDVNQMLFRQVRWFVDVASVDGFRLDAVKHVPSYFFGEQSGPNRDFSNAGYNGEIQEQFNVTHGFGDWGNHRDTVFDNGAPRDDALLYGEHLGAPPDQNSYLNAGMRIASDQFLNRIGGFGGVGNSLAGFDQPGFAVHNGSVGQGIMYCMSHDNTFIAGSDRPAAHQYMLTREGIPIVYTDGYNEANDFPKKAMVPFVGQFNADWVTGPLKVRRDFVRGSQIPKWSGENFLAYEMRDKRENGSMSDASGTVLAVMMARNYIQNAQWEDFVTTFPEGARLRNYSEHGGAFFAKVENGRIRDLGGGTILVPPNGYFAFSYDNPDEPGLWQGYAPREDIEIYQLNEGTMEYERAPTMTYRRTDGRDGDGNYDFDVTLPRVTKIPGNTGIDLRFLARSDGGAENVLMKLDGGIDINSQMNFGPQSGDLRDNPPGSAIDMFLGYEQMEFVQRVAEKFAARNVSRNIIGSPGCETYEAVIGTAGFSVNNGSGENTSTGTATWLYHDPAQDNQISPALQFAPAPESAADQAVTLWLKAGYGNEIDAAHVYYTTDGASFPEGLAGFGKDATQVADFVEGPDGNHDGSGQTKWWSATIGPFPSGTVLRYKIGGYDRVAPSRFTTNTRTSVLKRRMETQFEVTGFDPENVAYFPHNNHGVMATGLKEGFHVLRTRAFLGRTGEASIFRTATQTFYYDAQPPTGDLIFPRENDTLGGSTYGAVALSDATVNEVWYQIIDSAGTRPWSQANLVANPTQTAGTGFAREWRFDYDDIPSVGTATIEVRFKEPSSDPDNANNDPASGNYARVIRTVTTGFDANFRIGFPTADGEVVDDTYVMKTLFNNSLNPTVEEFSIFIASTESGQPVNEVLQDRAGYSIGPEGGETALAFTLPNLYNGDPDFLHHIRVVHQRGGVTLSDTRLVKAQPGPLPDADGDMLPDFWELLYGLDANNPDGVHGAEGDFDFDGVHNLAEYLGNTLPHRSDVQDFPIRSITSNLDGTYTLQFPVHVNRTYAVQYSHNLEDWFQAGAPISVLTENPSFQWRDDGTLTSPEPWNAGARFYRIEIGLPQ